MPTAPHIERHFGGSVLLRDLILGLSDGLTVPFALAAGLASAIGQSRLIVAAGLAELAAGAVAMGLGGYLAARSDAQHYDNELQRETREVRDLSEHEAEEIYEVFAAYGLSAEECRGVVEGLRRRPKAWVDFMMRFELGLEQPPPGQALRTAGTIGGAYVLGGLLPLLPYMLVRDGKLALQLSVVVTLMALAVFGAVKGKFTGVPLLRAAVQTVVVGGLAAAAAFFAARLLT